MSVKERRPFLPQNDADRGMLAWLVFFLVSLLLGLSALHYLHHRFDDEQADMVFGAWVMAAWLGTSVAGVALLRHPVARQVLLDPDRSVTSMVLFYAFIITVYGLALGLVLRMVDIGVNPGVVLRPAGVAFVLISTVIYAKRQYVRATLVPDGRRRGPG